MKSLSEEPLPSNYKVSVMVAIFSISLVILFTSQAGAQELSCDFNQNGKSLGITCLFGPSDVEGSFINPISSDPSVVAITNVSEGTETINDQIFEKQIVLAELKNIGFATLTVGTSSKTDTFEIIAQSPLLAVQIAPVLPLGTIPAGDFVGLDEGETFTISVRTVNLEDGSVMDVGGFAAFKLEGSNAFTFEQGGQGTIVHFGGGFGSVNLKVAENSLGETAKLLFQREGTGLNLVTNFQLSLASVQYEEATQSIDGTSITITFDDYENEPMATMTFSEENLDSIMVRTVKDADNGNDPLLLLPMFPEGNLVPRYYILEAYPQEATFNATMTLFYDESEFAKSSIEDESTIDLFRFNGVSWENWEGEMDPANNSVTVDGVSEFSIWAFANIEDTITDVDQVTPETSDRGMPSDPFLEQNYPNPFNPETTISYRIPDKARVVIKIFNLKGEFVRTLVDEIKSTGFYSIGWDGKDDKDRLVPSGIYYYQLKSRDLLRTNKMLFLK